MKIDRLIDMLALVFWYSVAGIPGMEGRGSSDTPYSKNDLCSGEVLTVTTRMAPCTTLHRVVTSTHKVWCKKPRAFLLELHNGHISHSNQCLMGFLYGNLTRAPGGNKH